MNLQLQTWEEAEASSLPYSHNIRPPTNDAVTWGDYKFARAGNRYEHRYWRFVKNIEGGCEINYIMATWYNSGEPDLTRALLYYIKGSQMINGEWAHEE